MQVQIFQPAKTATQSGTKKSPWIVVPIANEDHKSIDGVMGWTSSENTAAQLRLKFQNLEDAVRYTQKQNWNYQIIEPKKPQIVKKSYTDNFL